MNWDPLPSSSSPLAGVSGGGAACRLSAPSSENRQRLEDVLAFLQSVRRQEGLQSLAGLNEAIFDCATLLRRKRL